jgi:hypothetical protein
VLSMIPSLHVMSCRYGNVDKHTVNSNDMLKGSGEEGRGEVSSFAWLCNQYSQAM